MNEDKNPVVNVMTWLVNTLARTLVVWFDGLRSAIDHANPSLFGLAATVLPFLLPLPVAFMTSHSAQTFFEWEAWSANTLGIGLEVLGFLVWVSYVDAVIRSDTENVESYKGLFLTVALIYELLLVLINVILAMADGASLIYGLVLLLICALPALSAAVYGVYRRQAMALLDHEAQEAKTQRERERQERRQDRKEAQALKLGRQYASDTEGLKSPAKFRSGKR